ncbi:unnamed protein product [Mytilus coruscus]|uniref:Uncharacterized protein n=1 Tax=Mytilus coruscus TaxID=42192 RepID=A0A6J7ZWS0_MYTCO|nr:unnamed protein product [Mytilus coruscus]
MRSCYDPIRSQRPGMLLSCHALAASNKRPYHDITPSPTLLPKTFRLQHVSTTIEKRLHFVVTTLFVPINILTFPSHQFPGDNFPLKVLSVRCFHRMGIRLGGLIQLICRLASQLVRTFCDMFSWCGKKTWWSNTANMKVSTTACLLLKLQCFHGVGSKTWRSDIVNMLISITAFPWGYLLG